MDKEWADKVQEAVARLRTDPYAQAVAISQLKAEYVKARYNRDIKASDS
jgi:hypothetical protein